MSDFFRDPVPARQVKVTAAAAAAPPAAVSVATRPWVPANAPTGDLFKPQAPVKKKAPAKKRVADPDASRLRALKSLDLTDAAEALLCVPSAYVDCRSPRMSLCEHEGDERALFWLKKTGNAEALDANKQIVSCGQYDSIFDAPYPGYWSRIRQLRIELVDQNGETAWLAAFDPWRMRGEQRLGFVLLEAQARPFGSKTYLTAAVLPPIEAFGRVWVRYVCPGAPSEAEVLKLINPALHDESSFEACAHAVVKATLLSEPALLEIARSASGLVFASLEEFFRCLHQPSEPAVGEAAALAARAMGVAGICSAAKAANTRHPHAHAALNIQARVVSDLMASQPESLTDDQKNVISGLVTALRSPQPLNGLLSGDVGTGKTLGYAIPAVAAHMAGGKVAIVSPTEILANQVFRNLSQRFPSARIERVRAADKILDPSAILVGTSGLGTVAKKAGWTPNVLVIDEQHKLSTKDRNSMVAPWTHQLEASATPIPRSLAATLFSGTQVFELHQAPVKRAIQSMVLEESERIQVVSWMREAVDAGQRVAVIYPKVAMTVSGDAQDTKVIASVLDAAQALQGRFPGKVAVLHGKLSPENTSQNLEAFRSGQCPVVVASTIMETGIDIADIRLMVVKDADNFGIAQLHQLRGRLARNGGSARFVMMVADKEALQDETKQRLATLAKISDGYALAEADMASRGFGDLAGLAQSGNTACVFRLLKLTLADFSIQPG